MLYVRFPLLLRNVEDLLHERGIDISHEAARFWWNLFGRMFAAEIRLKPTQVQRWSFASFEINGLQVEKVRPQSRSLRHLGLRKHSPDPAPAGFLRCFSGLCGWGCSPLSVPKVSQTPQASPSA